MGQGTKNGKNKYAGMTPREITRAAANERESKLEKAGLLVAYRDLVQAGMSNY